MCYEIKLLSLLTRPIGRANSEVRLHFAASEMNLLKRPLSISGMTNLDIEEGSFNTRASYLSSQDIYGNAILASIGYTWRSKDLFNENISLQSYYRLLSDCPTPSPCFSICCIFFIQILFFGIFVVLIWFS